MKIIARRNAPLLVLAVHVAIDLVLISWVLCNDLPSTLPGKVLAYASISLPMAQGCLLALWAANSRMRFALRLLLALAGTAAALIVLLGLLEISVSDSYAAGWVGMLITQLLATMLLINGGRLVRRQFRLLRSGWTAADARSTQFSLRQLLLWTAILAIILGTGKALFEWLGWTAEILVDGNFYVLQILAVYNVFYALLVSGLFTVRMQWPMRIILFPLVVAAYGALAWSMSLVMQLLLGSFSRPGLHESLMLAAPQIIYHTVTLWPLWLCGYVGQRDDADTGPKETTPCRQQPTTTQEPR